MVQQYNKIKKFKILVTCLCNLKGVRAVAVYSMQLWENAWNHIYIIPIHKSNIIFLSIIYVTIVFLILADSVYNII